MPSLQSKYYAGNTAAFDDDWLSISLKRDPPG